MNEALIEKHLSPEARADLGEVILFEEIDSTNAESLRLLKAGKTGSWIVLAQSQIAGRGRSGRTWSSYKGAGIYLSLVRRFTLAADALQSLSLVTAISLHAALTALGVQNLQLKWPNDVLHEKRKLAGILLELHKMESTLHVVFGVGINLDLPAQAVKEIGRPVTDLNSLADNEVNTEELVALFINALLPNVINFEATGFSPFQDDWNRLDCYINHDIVIQNGNERIIGKSLGVDNSGAQLMQTATGRQTIIGGEIFPSLRELATGSPT
ncbi:MAG TPA: biotin--[acetyl-CoA-carboxylase] ligase [Gammaproteobacteria bacterium]|jgi:BirA family biotin operon repressor/biotin-[acetyl-CoA-carboxylase] ligase|nr:biotin--[acetyl-CoA-carboxylase] ligase [Gammaproteobacteria bacterium]HIF85974.1 biotin--[acetyl-CoA-carboxylase] ligase [Gammaproteobacteria bacterium]HIL64412.1 biotin--[acetyl-CoA-carboxylase] ligase [Porticoccaceae bacterium]